ncbi:MAG: DNA gyrase subunit A [Candidatus Methanospirareceae archaeon]
MRYCVTGDTLVLTDRGIMPIIAISSGKEIEEMDIDIKVINYSGEEKRASKFFNSGKHPIIKLVTEHGYEIKGSHNHPLLCWCAGADGKPEIRWKLLEELSHDDYVILAKYSFFNENEVSLREYHPYESNIPLPGVMDEDFAFLLGVLLSKGKCRSDIFKISDLDSEIYERVREVIGEKFKGMELCEGVSGKGKRYLSFRHRGVVRFLENLGLKREECSKEIPSVILRAPKGCVKEFLKALFESSSSFAGDTDAELNELTYDSGSKKLIQQLQVVLLSFGIISSLVCDKESNSYKLIISGYENIKKFKEEIGLFSERKEKILDKIEKVKEDDKTDFIPFIKEYLRRKYNSDFIKEIEGYSSIKRHYEKLRSILDEEDIKLVDWLLEKEYFFDKVKHTEGLEADFVYSIKVESECHSYIANGFINHNTEARLSKIAKEMLVDIEKNTVDWSPNFDNTLKEPRVLPAKLPNLLINGSSGIAVGMATNMPPHNLRDVVDAIIKVIEEPGVSIEELIRIIKAPDFPTGGVIVGYEGVKEAYKTGKGNIKVRARVEIEKKKGRERIIVKEIPYQVNKSKLVEDIAKLVRENKIESIADIRDESDRRGLRIVIELKPKANAAIVLNKLYKYTQMENTFGVINLALVNGEPRILNLKELIRCYVKHRKEVTVKRLEYELERAEKRRHILEGLLIALAHIEEVVELLKTSEDNESAKENLMRRYELSEEQAKEILNMRLSRLIALERSKIEREREEKVEEISRIREILAKEERIFEIIKEELIELKEKYGDERRTSIEEVREEISEEDLIEEKRGVIIVTGRNYIKRLPESVFKRQKRGGKGVEVIDKKEKDEVVHFIRVSTRERVLFFTSSGRVYQVKAYEIAESSRHAKGKALVNVIDIEGKDQKISAVISVPEDVDEKIDDFFLLFATKRGIIKKSSLSNFKHIRSNGVTAINIMEGDGLACVSLMKKGEWVILGTKKGKVILFDEEEVRDMGKYASGVRGVKLEEGDEVVSIDTVDMREKEKIMILTVTERGYGKRTRVDEYRKTHRGSKGVIGVKIGKGYMVCAKAVKERDDVIVVTSAGMAARLPAKEISAQGRNTQGVKVIDVGEEDRVVMVEVLR